MREVSAGPVSASIHRYQLNYGWAHQPGWTDETTLTLLGRVTGAAAIAAVTAWFEGLHECERPEERGLRYHGGATMQLGPQAGWAMVLALRSRGEDACDSLAWYAGEVADVVVAALGDPPGHDPAASLIWVEVPISPTG